MMIASKLDKKLKRLADIIMNAKSEKSKFRVSTNRPRREVCPVDVSKSSLLAIFVSP